MRNFIRKWLGLPTVETTASHPLLVNGPRNFLPEVAHRNMFEVINAINGKIVVYNKHTMNPHGMDKNDMEIYLVHEGEDLMATITRAMISASLK